MAGRKRTTTLIRFEEKFQKRDIDECWPWKAALKGPKGNQYGNFRMSKNIGAHQASWLLYKGDIPPGAYVLHKCDNPICVNPNHLFLGNAKINSDDCHMKGRGPVTSQFKSQFPDELVAEIRRSYQDGEGGYMKLGKRFGVSTGHVRQLVKRSRRK